MSDNDNQHGHGEGAGAEDYEPGYPFGRPEKEGATVKKVDWNTLIACLVTLAVPGLIQSGIQWSRITELETKVEKVETSGSAYAQNTRFVVDAHTTIIAKHDAKIDALTTGQNDMRSDLRILVREVGTITEWVRKQDRQDGKP